MSMVSISRKRDYIIYFQNHMKKIFFLRNQEILYFLCVLDPGDHFTKSRPARVRTKLEREKNFNFK